MKKILFLFLLLLSTTIFAQKVTSSVDTTRNKIGAKFLLTLKTTVGKNDKVKFPETKNFGALEIIESYKIDTVKKNESLELIKKYGLTQFDSGRYSIPKIRVVINGKPVFTDSIALEVTNVKVDTLKQKMYDIKTVQSVETSNNWWIYLLLFVVFVWLSFGIFWFLKNRKKPQKEEEIV
jgi:ATP-dependent Zn protease